MNQYDALQRDNQTFGNKYLTTLLEMPYLTLIKHGISS